jgi:hypothetical protein
MNIIEKMMINGKLYKIWTTVNGKSLAQSIANKLRKDIGHIGTGIKPKSVRVVKGNNGNIYSVFYR